MINHSEYIVGLVLSGAVAVVVVALLLYAAVLDGRDQKRYEEKEKARKERNAQT